MRGFLSTAAPMLVRAAALVALCGSTVAAQEPVVRWDSLGLAKATDVAFLLGPAVDGSLDTLFVPGSVPDPHGGTNSGVWRLLPGAGTWEDDYHWAPAGVEYLMATASGSLLAGASGGPIAHRPFD